jgi:hypothetical protein
VTSADFVGSAGVERKHIDEDGRLSCSHTRARTCADAIALGPTGQFTCVAADCMALLRDEAPSTVVSDVGRSFVLEAVSMLAVERIPAIVAAADSG